MQVYLELYLYLEVLDMGQISLYVDDAIISRLNILAGSKNCSVSKCVAEIVSERFLKEDNEELQKKELLRNLRGAVKDSSLVEPQTISYEADIPRRYDFL